MNCTIKAIVTYTRNGDERKIEAYYYHNMYAVNDPLEDFYKAHEWENVRVESCDLYYARVTSYTWEPVPDNKQIPMQSFR